MVRSSLSIAIFESPSSALVVAILVMALSAVIVNVVAPRVMSSAVGVHPLLVFVGILAGAKLAGVWGAVFGVPAVAVISAMAVFYHKHYAPQATQLERVLVTAGIATVGAASLVADRLRPPSWRRVS